MSDLIFDAYQDNLCDGSPVAIMKLQGSIEAKSVSGFEKQINEFFDQGIKYLILNFAEVTYVNSSGLGFLVHIADRTEEIGGVVCLVAIHPKISSIFTMMGIDDLFSILENEKEALNLISETFITSDARLAAVTSPSPAETAPSSASPPPLPVEQGVEAALTTDEQVTEPPPEQVPAEAAAPAPPQPSEPPAPAPEPVAQEPAPAKKVPTVKRAAAARQVRPLRRKMTSSVFQRKISVHFYKQIYAKKPFPLRIEVVAPPSQREEKISHRTLSVLTLVPHFPECQVRPEKVNMDVSKNQAVTSFAIAAPRPGEHEGWIKVMCRDRQIKALKVNTKITKHPVDLVAITCVVLFPLLSLLGHALKPELKLPIYGFLAGGVALMIMIFLYFQRLPRKAAPVEKLFLVPPASIKRRS